MIKEFVLITLSTLISEDLTCISVGLLIQADQISVSNGILSCTLGIFLGDYLLFLTGKELHGMLRKREKFQFLFTNDFFTKTAIKLEKNYIKTIFLSRFMPGTRLPIYTFAGMTSKTSLPFIFTSFVASVIWTPAMIYLSFLYGESFKKFYDTNLFYISLILTGSSLFFLYQIILAVVQKERRLRFMFILAKITKLEFWPSWLFYIPLVPYVCYLIVRYGKINIITASNPGIPFGGIALESKYDILSSLKSDHITKTYKVHTNQKKDLAQELKLALEYCGGKFPIILKPDIGERGSGVHLVHSFEDAKHILENHNIDYLVQEYHPGPFEAGIFYYRYPGESMGIIFSITDKIFPYILGDGKSSLSILIKNHDRFKFQEETFQKRFSEKLDWIPEIGQKVSLGFAGNHIQGCLFQDGSQLITKELALKIDEISKTFDGFYFGRYDIRYMNEEDLKNGKNFKIIELNGAMSESTNLYDPKFSIFQSYSILFKQWKILFEIGAANYKNGARVYTLSSFIQLMKQYSIYKKNLDPIAKEIML
ncbi:MAG: VTT domain-containing protein [Leptospira sp.]|nr:VTT domain-containing protein [Leptospira sp.]